jgi:hypothetical protein
LKPTTTPQSYQKVCHHITTQKEVGRIGQDTPQNTKVTQTEEPIKIPETRNTDEITHQKVCSHTSTMSKETTPTQPNSLNPYRKINPTQPNTNHQKLGNQSKESQPTQRKTSQQPSNITHQKVYTTTPTKPLCQLDQDTSTPKHQGNPNQRTHQNPRNQKH